MLKSCLKYIFSNIFGCLSTLKVRLLELQFVCCQYTYSVVFYPLTLGIVSLCVLMGFPKWDLKEVTWIIRLFYKIGKNLLLFYYTNPIHVELRYYSEKIKNVAKQI